MGMAEMGGGAAARAVGAHGMGGERCAGATQRGSGDAGGAGGFPTVSLIEIGSPGA